jgi:N-formylglutamate amidohydrolase
MRTCSAPVRCIGNDADLYVDELYAEAPSVGGHPAVAEISRYVCDLNRSEQDVDPLAAMVAWPNVPRTASFGGTPPKASARCINP